MRKKIRRQKKKKVEKFAFLLSVNWLLFAPCLLHALQSVEQQCIFQIFTVVVLFAVECIMMRLMLKEEKTPFFSKNYIFFLLPTFRICSFSK